MSLSKKIPYRYLKVILALLLTFWALSALEVFTGFQSEKTAVIILKTIGLKFLNDFWAVAIIGILFCPIYYILNLGKKKFGEAILLIFCIILVLGEFSLVQYSQTTLLNLGADLLGYSFDDISRTVSSSTSFSLLSLLPIFLFPLLFISARYFFIKKMTKTFIHVVVIVCTVLVVFLKFFMSEFNDTNYQNKIDFLFTDIIKSKLSTYQSGNYTVTDSNKYPLLKASTETKDVLKPFFNVQSEKPNIVMVVLEGLGSEFVDGNAYSGFSPYLDSLITQSLYWENFVSTTGRTFGVVPSLVGSLPFGENGFLEIQETPTHVSLFNILKENGYTTSFYTGTQSSFDNIIKFLEYNNVDFVEDQNKFGKEYQKTEGNSSGFSWGFPDSELFRKTLSTLDDKKGPRFDVILTLSNHEPFSFPRKTIYESKVDSLLNSNQVFKVSKSNFSKHKDIFGAILYVDNSLESFMKSYEKRDDFKKTIFIITGDHRLIPIEQKDKLSRFHVPFIIYSPMLKKPARFKSVSSHLDVAPSLMAFLANNYNLSSIKNTAWMGTGLDTAKSFRNIHQIGLMRYKGGLKDFIYKDYLYNEGDLFKISSSFDLKKITDEHLLKKIQDSFAAFKKLNTYVTSQNKIYPLSLVGNFKKVKVEFTEAQQLQIKELTEGRTMDEVFLIARENAFNEKREVARLLCNYILNDFPNHSDARILKGRTLSWDGKYIEAEETLLDAVNRDPFYFDSYSALLDMYWWSNQEEKGVGLAKKALKNKIENPEIAFKLAKSYQRLNQKLKSETIIDSLLKIYPKNNEYIAFKNLLK